MNCAQSVAVKSFQYSWTALKASQYKAFKLRANTRCLSHAKHGTPLERSRRRRCDCRRRRCLIGRQFKESWKTVQRELEDN